MNKQKATKTMLDTAVKQEAEELARFLSGLNDYEREGFKWLLFWSKLSKGLNTTA